MTSGIILKLLRELSVFISSLITCSILPLRALHYAHGIVFEDPLADGVFEGGVQQIVIMQNRLLTVAVLAQVIVEAVNEARLAVGERDLFVKVGTVLDSLLFLGSHTKRNDTVFVFFIIHRVKSFL